MTDDQETLRRLDFTVTCEGRECAKSATIRLCCRTCDQSLWMCSDCYANAAIAFTLNETFNNRPSQCMQCKTVGRFVALFKPERFP